MNSAIKQWAKETIQKMMTEGIAPTPENYQKIYAEISGQQEEKPFPQKELRELNGVLNLHEEKELSVLNHLEEAIEAKNWANYLATWQQILNKLRTIEALHWGDLLEDLLRALESHHLYFTVAKKREMLKTLLSIKKTPPDLLFQKMQGLIHIWGNPKKEESLVEDENQQHKENQENNQENKELKNADSVELRQLLAEFVQTVLVPFLAKNPNLAKEAENWAQSLCNAKSNEDCALLAKRLKRLHWQLELFIEEQSAQQEGIFKLVRLLIENMEALSVDDSWLSGQLHLVQEVVDKPLSLRVLGEAERRLSDVLYKQGQMKIDLLESRGSLTALLADFVEQIAGFSESTSDYHDKLNVYAHKIGQSKNLCELDGLLNEVISETRAMQKQTQTARDDLQLAKQRVATAQKRILELEKALEETSDLVRRDTLTGVLNRRGLNEVMLQEIARALRSKQKLSVGLLDLDNFKKLNDHYGHDVGDKALKHLSKTCKHFLRPQDSVARYGGEEFVIVLPGADANEAQLILQRLQRALTKEIFMHNNEKLLITFSAGVTEVHEEDAKDDILKRADSAMYAAKNAGKNRVLVAI